MRITCPECSAGFDVPDGAITKKGRKLRCSQCKHQWHQMPVVEEAAAAPDDEAPQDTMDEAGDPGDGDGAQGFSMFGTGGRDPGAEADDDEFDDPPIPDRGAFGRGKPEGRARPPIALFVLVGLLLLIPGILLGARAPLVAMVPAISPLFDAVGLHVSVPGENLIIQNVGAWRKVDGGVEVMLIQGEIHNPTRMMQSVPVLRGTMEDAAGRLLESAPYTPEAAILVPGDTLAFHYEIPNPNPQAVRVTVTFSDEDRQGGLGH